ncbi:MAG: hypothetical protein J5725_04090 [Bacteroidales bacterium]|nr:hypothetical protein [Bacteroidales bacterium]
MKKALKELLEKAEPRVAGRYDAFLIIDDHKQYNGFWGKNGFNSMTILGYDKTTQQHYLISTKMSDVLTTFDKMSWNIDIPSNYGCIRIWFDHPVYITLDTAISSIRVDSEEQMFAKMAKKGLL